MCARKGRVGFISQSLCGTLQEHCKNTAKSKEMIQQRRCHPGLQERV